MGLLDVLSLCHEPSNVALAASASHTETGMRDGELRKFLKMQRQRYHLSKLLMPLNLLMDWLIMNPTISLFRGTHNRMKKTSVEVFFFGSKNSESYAWRKEYITTFLERDLSNMGFRASPRQMRKLWTMLAHYHGNIINYSDLGRSLGITYKTIQAHIDILEGAFMVRCLRPWYENIKKRQIKAPKLYIRDSGMLHALLDIHHTPIELHPKVGASWEGFALEEVVFASAIYYDDCYYWRTQAGVELDLLVFQEGKRIGYEFKYADAPKVTRSMRIAMQDLSLHELNIVVPVGTEVYSLDTNIHVRGLRTFAKP